MDEEQLIRALRNQDPAALQELVGFYGDRLFRSACLLCGDQDEAQDLVQETLLQVFRSAHRFKGNSRVYTWMHAILLNLTRHHHRDRGRIVYDEERMLQEPAPVEHKPCVLDMQTSAATLEQALQHLSEPHREVVVLRFYEDMKIQEIAAHLELSSGTVKSRLHYAIAEMQRLLPQELNLFGAGGTQERGKA